MRTFPLTPAPPAPPGFDITLTLPNAPPPAAPASPAAGCTCANLGMLWGENIDVTQTIGTDLPVPVIAVATGDICPGTEWTIDIDWGGDPDFPPTINQVGTAAWSVSPTGAGTLTLTFHADCGGESITTNSITLIVSDASSECITTLQLYDATPSPISSPQSVSIPTTNPLGNLFKCYVGGDPTPGDCCGGSIVSEFSYEGDDYQTDLANPFWTRDASAIIPPDIGCSLEVRVDDVWFDNPGMSGTGTFVFRYLDADSNEIATLTLVLNISS